MTGITNSIWLGVVPHRSRRQPAGRTRGVRSSPWQKSRSGAKPNPGWFRKGQSGNSNGRPSASRPPRASALDVIAGKTLTLAHGGGMREIAVEEALQQRTYRDAVAGKRMAETALICSRLIRI